LLARRCEEFDEYLKQGKPLVVILTEPEEYAVFTRVDERPDKETGETKKTKLYERRSPLARALPVRLAVEPLRGDAMEIAGSGPFVDFWQEWSEIFHHEAVLTQHPGVAVLRVPGTRKTLAAIAEHQGGTLVPLPPFEDFSYPNKPPTNDGPNPAHVDLVDALMRLVELHTGHEQLPGWTERLVLPGERDARRRLTAAQAKTQTWRDTALAREEALRQIQRRKGLLTASGTALERLVEEALTTLGFEVEVGPDGRVDRVLRLGDRVAVVEVKGQKHSAKEGDAAQLNKWVAAYHADHGVQPKGILVVNAYRDLPLPQRTDEAFPHQMLGFAVDQQEFCLITGEQVLALWLKAEAEPDKRRALAESILDCVGVFDGPGMR
jgi:hypothetical protein